MNFILCLLLLTPLPAAPGGTPTAWTGAVSSDWSNPANWTAGVPNLYNTVSIPFYTPNVPSITGNAACGDIMCSGGLNISGTLDVYSNVVCDGVMYGTGRVRLVDQNPGYSLIAHVSGGGTLSAELEVAKNPNGGAQITSVFNLGILTVTSGNLYAAVTGTITVSDHANFHGGTLSATAPGCIIDIAGDVTFSGTNATGVLPILHCGGNWTSDANFAPSGALVFFDGTSPQTLSAAAPFDQLGILANASVTAITPLTVNWILTIDGSLDVSSQTLDANGPVSITPPGLLALGAGTHTFADAFTVTGTVSGTGTVVFDGSWANNTVSCVSPLPNVRIANTAGASTQVNSNLTINGNLVVTSGTFTSLQAFTVAVSGNAQFLGGTLAALGMAGIIDVAGNVTFSGTSATGSVPSIKCGGNWSADTNYAPTSGTVELNGSAATTIASASPGGVLTFQNLVIKNGARTMANDFTIAAATMTVDPTGSLAISGGRRLRINRTGTTNAFVDGGLTIAPNGELSMGPQTVMNVGPTGTLNLVGAVGQPSKITGASGGGYGLIVNGTLAASNFLVKEMGPGGMLVGLVATIAAAPNNLSNGTFDFRSGALAGSVLLDLRRQAPAADFQSLTFLNTPGVTGVFNVRTSAAGVPIAFTNYAGAFAGSSFENDPHGLICWNLQPAPPVALFRVRLGAELVEVMWASSNPANIASYEVRHAFSPTGPFTLVAQGVSAASFGYVDHPLAANVPVWEAVWAVMTGGERMLFGVGTATPYSASPPPNVYKVGGNGPFGSIQSAINAATAPNSVVMVTPGTYPAFTIGSSAPQNLHIAASAPGQVTIDTSSGPVVISNVAAGNGVELGDLTIGSTVTGQPALQIVSCAGVVVLDALVVACNGAETAVAVSGSQKVAMQRCTISGGTGLSVSSASHVGVSKGSLSSLVATGSTIEMAELTPGSVSVTPAGSLLTRGGMMPNMTAPRFASMGQPQVLVVDAFPNGVYVPVASPTMAFSSIAGVQMPVLVDPGYLFQLSPMMTDALGHGVTSFEIEPTVALLGFTYVTQVVCFDPVSGAARMSNSLTVTSMP